MRIPTESELDQLLEHAYDPVKAHEYYIKNRKLKGRAGSKKTENSKFVSTLAYTKEGGDRKVAAQLVKWAQGKSDAQIRSEIKRVKTKYGDNDATMAFTLNQILDHRTKVRAGKTPASKPSATKTAQRKAIQQQVKNLQDKLKRLKELIREKQHEAAAEDRKSKAKAERAAKDADKPKTAAEKADAAREAKKYRDEHQQELKNKSDDKASTAKKSFTKNSSVSDLKALATKVEGQIAVAKQKLAAL